MTRSWEQIADALRIGGARAGTPRGSHRLRRPVAASGMIVS